MGLEYRRRKNQIREVKLQWKDGVLDEKLDGTTMDPYDCQSSVVVVVVVVVAIFFFSLK